MASYIDPWESNNVKIDSNLIEQFGLEKINENLFPCGSHLFSRGIIVAHRGFDAILDCIKNKKDFIQLTGIASSGPLHLGHKLDVDIYLLFKEMGAKSKFVISDIDAYVSRPDSKIPDLDTAKKIAVDNIAHLLALGVDKEDIYVQSNMNSRYYEFAFEISKKITENSFRATYGHVDLGKVSANLLQYSDILHLQLEEYFGPMPSITGIGIEQEPHARVCRDLSRKLNYKLFPPSFVYFLHQSGLQEGSKMSASKPETAIFLSDSVSDMRRKIKKSFSGGRETLEEHREFGGDPDIDKAYEILRYHCLDSELVVRIYEEYKSGKMLTGELKKICIEFLENFLVSHQEKVKQNKEIARKIVYGN